MLHAFYDSPWHHPTFAWAAAALTLAALALPGLSRRPRAAGLQRAGVTLALFSAADAWVTGAWSPFPPGSGVASLLAIVFVVVGDGRFFWLLERPRVRRGGVATLLATPWALALPLLLGVLRGVVPALADDRAFFLSYEAAFVVLASARGVLALRAAPGALRRWQLGLVAFELAQYGLWATADALLLAHVEAGWGLRLVANVLYYCAFVPVAVWSAPPRAATPPSPGARLGLAGVAAIALLFVAGSAGAAPTAAGDEQALRIVDANGRVTRLPRPALEQLVPPERFTAFDPYYKKDKRWRALPLAALLKKALPGAALDDAELVLRAKDGYTVPISAKKLLDGSYLVLADEDAPGWEPIGPQRTNPAPFYLVWRRPDQRDLDEWPRPWGLVAIEVARFESLFPHVAPTGVAADAPAMRGFRLFRVQCFRCHAINREGGRVGPELNVPKSIVEYRPEAQIRAYIKNPLEFRYGNMPPHPNLRDADLDDLVAYFRHKRGEKHDPEARPQ